MKATTAEGFGVKEAAKPVQKVTASDTEDVTFRQIGEWLNEKPNTVSARYFPKVCMAHEGLKGYPSLQSKPGKPTGYAAKCIEEYLYIGKSFDKYVLMLKERYSEPPAASVKAEVISDDTEVTEDDTSVTRRVTSAIAKQDARRQDRMDETTALAAMAILSNHQVQLATGSSQKKSKKQEAYEAEMLRLAQEEQALAEVEAGKAQAREDFLRLKQDLTEDA